MITNFFVRKNIDAFSAAIDFKVNLTNKSTSLCLRSQKANLGNLGPTQNDMKCPTLWWLNHFGVSLLGRINLQSMSSSSDIESLASDANSSKSREERTNWCDNRFNDCGSTDMSLLAPWKILLVKSLEFLEPAYN